MSYSSFVVCNIHLLPHFQSSSTMATSDCTSDNATSDRTSVNATSDCTSVNATSDHTSVDATSDHTSVDATSDHTSVDATSDHTSVDATSVDATLDRTSVDATLDRTSVDATLDRTSVDATLDRTSADATLDHTSADATLDHTSADATLDHTSADATCEHNSDPTSDYTSVTATSSASDPTPGRTFFTATSGHTSFKATPCHTPAISDQSIEPSNGIVSERSFSTTPGHEISSNLSDSLEAIQKGMSLPCHWVRQFVTPFNKLHVCKLNCTPSSSKQPLAVTHCLTIQSDLTWSLFVHNQPVTPENCPLVANIPAQVTAETMAMLIKLSDQLNVCPGQPDDNFVELARLKKGVLADRHEQPVARLDDYAPVSFKGRTYSRTVRPVKCELLVRSGKCAVCKKYRNTLRVISNRYKSRSLQNLSDSSSHSNFKCLTTPEKKARMTNLKKRAHNAEKEVKKLQAKIQQLTDKCGENVDKQLHNDLVSVMKENSKHVSEVYPEGTFANVFWNEQLKAALVKDSRQMRWHPLIIRWCLNLKLLSSSAYHATRTAGFVKLPSERTLRDYTHYFKHQAGYQVEVLKQLQKESKVKELPNIKKFCGLIIDEMKIREGLVYDKYTGEVSGFCNIGEINNELLELERRCQGERETPAVAKHMLVVMLRGVFFKLDFPLAHFSCTDLTGDQIFPIVWDGVRLVESIDLKVLFITADGASSNRRFFRMHKGCSGTPTTSTTESEVEHSDVVYRTKNRYASDEDRWLYFISDPPHLIKTTRNCLYHSAFGGTRLMTVS